MSKQILTRGGYALPGTSSAFKTGDWRVRKPVYQHVSAPCHGVCPAGEDPQAYIAEMDAGRPQQAWEELVSVNPLPAITGRVCPHPCESSCNRREYDDAVAIHSIERFLGDEAIAQGWAYPVTPPPKDAPRVAVVGSGPAGLSCAYHLLRLGYQVTLFTALGEAGGTLRLIPGYRLPTKVIDEEIDRVLQTGIDFRPNHRLGRDIHLDELRAEYAAVFLGVGTEASREWSIGGVTPKDLHVGLRVLEEWMAVGSVPETSSVAIVGGGNTAVDVSRILKRTGIPDVHIITHNALPPTDGSKAPADVMPAVPREVEQALEEGVIIHPHRGIHRLILRGAKVVGVEMTHMKKMPDTTGRLQRKTFQGTETVLHVDQVIPAIGQVVDHAGLEAVLNGESFLPVDAWRRIQGHENVFAGGDACSVSGGTVTAAVGDGRIAAESIAKVLAGQALPEEQDPAASAITFGKLNANYFEPLPRHEQAILPPDQRIGEIETESTLKPAQVSAEARRCLSCGNCMSCDNCWTLCPDSAVLRLPEGHADEAPYRFDYDYCKGCGLCANECPCGFIEMTEDI